MPHLRSGSLFTLQVSSIRHTLQPSSPIWPQGTEQLTESRFPPPAPNNTSRPTLRRETKLCASLTFILHCPRYPARRYHNFFAQLQGRKAFKLFPPSAWRQLHVYPFLHPSHAQCQVCANALLSRTSCVECSLRATFIAPDAVYGHSAQLTPWHDVVLTIFGHSSVYCSAD